MVQEVVSSALVNRMIRAARLDVNLYEEVEADATATSQALTVVAMASVAAGIGSLVLTMMLPQQVGAVPILGLVGGLLRSLLGWALWSYVAFFVGTRFFGGTGTYGEVLRTLGFANSPGVLLIVLVIPVIGAFIAFFVAIWILWASFIAIRQALDIDNMKTVATIVVGAIAYIIVGAILSIFRL